MTHPPRTALPVMANGRPNPTGTGRYCPPKVCYCRGCSWWAPAPQMGYSPSVASSGAQRRSWAQRTEPTWIDTL